MELLQIDISNSEFYYPLFYKLAFLAGFLIILGIGIKRKYPLGTWILLNSTATVFAIIGSKIGTFGWEEWQYFIETGVLPDTGRKTAFGGMIFGLLGLLISKKLLDFKAPVLDAYIWSGLAVMIVQRFGCLSAGCCYGLPYDGFGAVVYQSPGHLLYNQTIEGLLPFGENITLPVHNIPLYFIISLLAISLIIKLLHKHFKNKSALGFFGLGLVLGTRFFIEFFRDPNSNHTMTEEYWGLKTIQWALLCATFILFGIAYYLSISHKNSTYNLFENPTKTAHGIAVLSLIVFLLNDWFEVTEIIVIHIKLVLSISLILFAQVRLRKTHLLRSPLLMMLIGCLAMGQSYKFTPNSGDTSVTTFELRTTGGNLGASDYTCLRSEEGCFGPVCVLADSLRPVGPQYYSTTLDMDVVEGTNKKVAFVYGVNGNLEMFYNAENDFGRFFGNGRAYLGFEGRKYFGMRAGVRFGKMYGSYSRTDEVKTLLPTFSYWFGNKNIGTFRTAFFDDNILGGSPSIVSAEMNIVGNFINDDLETFSIGVVDLMAENISLYGKIKYRLNDTYTLNPTFGWVFQEEFLKPKGAFFSLGISKDLKQKEK